MGRPCSAGLRVELDKSWIQDAVLLVYVTGECGENGPSLGLGLRAWSGRSEQQVKGAVREKRLRVWGPGLSTKAVGVRAAGLRVWSGGLSGGRRAGKCASVQV